MKNLSNLFNIVFLLVAICVISFTVPQLAEAREGGILCCDVTSIDAKSGLVTSKENNTGKIFQFKVKDAKLLKTLNVGDKVSVDFNAGKVAVLGLSPCCSIIKTPATSGK